MLESKDKKYPVGSLMVSHQGWCDKGKINPSKLPPTEFCMPAPDLKVVQTQYLNGTSDYLIAMKFLKIE